MTSLISEQEKLFRFAKMVVAHIISLRGFDEFQEGAVEMLSHLLIQTIKILACKVKAVLQLQKRIIPNSLHLLAISHQMPLFPLQQIHKHLTASREREATERDHFLTSVGCRLFSSCFRAKRDSKHPNISFVPSAFTFDLKKALPKRREIYELLNLKEKGSEHVVETYALLAYLNASVIDLDDSKPPQPRLQQQIQQISTAYRIIKPLAKQIKTGKKLKEKANHEKKAVIAINDLTIINLCNNTQVIQQRHHSKKKVKQNDLIVIY